MANNCVSITPKMLPRIFDAFEQGGFHVILQFSGLGLGLANRPAWCPWLRVDGAEVDASAAARACLQKLFTSEEHLAELFQR